jgi:hypothetical protein
VNIDKAEHEGWVGAEPFDLTWTEGLTPKEEKRHFRLETDAQERDILRIETTPMRNPNGAENTIIGRLTGCGFQIGNSAARTERPSRLGSGKLACCKADIAGRKRPRFAVYLGRVLALLCRPL